MKIKKSSHYIWTMIAALFLLIASCTKDNSRLDSSLPGQVEIALLAITDPPLQKNGGIGTLQSSVVPLKSGKSLSVVKEEDFDNFSWTLSVDRGSASLKSQNPDFRSSHMLLAAVPSSTKTKMDLGKKFRILFYEIANGNEIYHTSEEITVASQRYLITLSPNVTYNWYAYSYNNANSIPLPQNLSSPEIESKTDAPLLYDHGTINTGNEAKIDIAFQHQIAKVEVKVDAREVYANSFSTLQANFDNLPLVTKSFNLKDGMLAAQATTTSNTNTVINFVDDGSAAIKKSTNDIYTAQFTNLPIRFTEISINKTGETVVLIANTSPKTAVIGGFTSDLKYIKRGVVDLKYKGGIIGTNEWTKGILYYDDTDPANPYKISEPFMSRTDHLCNYYWTWNSLMPRSITGNVSGDPAGDPCSMVYPAGSWRTPTSQDFSLLGSAFINSPSSGAAYYNASNGERVYFHEGGTITGSNCNVGNKNDGYFWSIDENNSSRGVALEVDGDAAGVNQLRNRNKTYGFCIKCIRVAAP